MTVRIPLTVLIKIITVANNYLSVEDAALEEIPLEETTLESLRALVNRIPDGQFKAWALNELKDGGDGDIPE